MTKVEKIKNSLSSVTESVQKGVKKIYLAIPKDVDSEIPGSLRDVFDAAQALGIATQSADINALQATHDSISLTNNLLTVTEKGIAVSAEHVDKLLQKLSKKGAITSDSAGARIDQGKTFLSTINSIIDTALAGIELNSLLNSEDKNNVAIAQGAIDIVSKTIDIAVNSIETIDKFSETLANLGSTLQNIKGLDGVSSLLKNTPNVNLGTASTILEGLSGVLGGIGAGFILGSADADTNQKIAAGFELSNQIVGNVTKTVTQILLAQRIASGASVTGPVAGLIASSVSLAISPLSFYGVAKKFEYSNEIQNLANKFKPHGYEGDEFLANFYKESGVVDASLTTVNTFLGAVSSGISAAAAGSVVGAPVALIVGAVTGIVTGILDASKQSILDSIAGKYQQKILEWEKQHPGENFFERGYDSRYAQFLKENMAFLNEIADAYKADSLVTVTQQGWDQQIGELAAITKLGEKINSGKVFADVIEEGRTVENNQTVNIDPTKGTIYLNSKHNSQALTFLTPLLSSTEEQRVRHETGKNEYITELRLGTARGWDVIDNGNTHTIADFSNIVQRVVFNDGKAANITLNASLGNGDDTIYIGKGGSVINGGDGTDTVNYTKSQSDWAEFSAIDGVSGNYTVKRNVTGDIYHEKIGSQTVTVGKSTETIQYRHAVLVTDTFITTDKLYSVEKLIGTSWRDLFNGGEQTDYFSGGKGHDEIKGNGGNDYLYGGDDNDLIFGGDGNDVIRGGKDNDTLNGGSGNDTYFYKKGDGKDYLSDTAGSNDLLVLEGINAGELSFSRNSYNLEMKINGMESIVFEDWYYQEANKEKYGNYTKYNKTDYKIEAIVTGDGKSITSDKIDALISAMSAFNVSDISINSPEKIFDDVLTQKFSSSSLV